MVELHVDAQSQELFPVASNVNSIRLEQLLDVVEKTNRQTPFVDRKKELVIMGRNPNNLYLVLSELLPAIMPNHSGPYPESSHLFAHHLHGATAMIRYANTRPHYGEPLHIMVRTKGTASLLEKMARLLSEKGTITDPKHPAHALVEDLYGISMVTKTAQECYVLRDQLSELPCFWQDTLRAKDYLQGNKNGYRALHDTLHWYNGSPVLNELRIRAHYETEEDFIKNKIGDGINPKRAHRAYAECKLEKPHTLGNYQVVVIDHRGNLDTSFSIRHIDLSERLNGTVRYHLLRSKMN